MAGLSEFATRVKILFIVGFFFLKTVFADYDAYCYSFECTGIEYCCGYHYCCTDYTQIWYVWLLIILFVCFIISLITCCCIRRRNAGVVIRGQVVTQNPNTTYTTTTIRAPEPQQPIFYGAAPPTYGATTGYQPQYQPYAGAPPAYQAQQAKGPSAPLYNP